MAFRLCSFLIITSLLSTVGRPWLNGALPGEIQDRLRTDSSALAAASTDFGGVVSAAPAAVFQPSSPPDIAALIRFSASLPTPLPIAARGEGHSLRGQASAAGGVVINMSSLAHSGERRINVSPSGKFADVGGEQLWIDVLRATLPHGLSPRSFTDYLHLSVGGTLSNAGIGGQSFRHGPQISNVIELDVVTGNGDVITCNSSHSSELFFAALGGLGQFGVITRARVALEPAPDRVRWVRLVYTDVRTFTVDQELLISGETFDYVEGMVLLNYKSKSSSFFSSSELDKIRKLANVTLYVIEGAMYYNHQEAAASVEDRLDRLFSGLRFEPGFRFARDVSYLRFLDRVRQEELQLRAAGAWNVPHRWLNLFVPKSKIAGFDGEVFKGILRDDDPVGLILMYPMHRSKWNERTSAVTPEEEVFYAVGLLRSEVRDDGGELEKQNGAVSALCRRIGCKQYLAGYTEEEKWAAHFGPKWARFAGLKAKYDPRAILSPGQRIFSRRWAAGFEAQ